MKKTSTSKQNQMSCKTSSPSVKTLEFIKQFARSYKALTLANSELCGVALN